MQHDLVIRNGTIIDGSGLAGFRADVAISDGHIERIGKVRGRGREEIDATGAVVTPGFIDGHTHMDAQIFWDHLGTNVCWHGVTTVVMGNCGFTLAPTAAEDAALAVRNLERAEDISPKAMAEGITWSWTSFSEYLDTLDRLPKALNYVTNVGHSALRTHIMGPRAFDEEATPDDLEAMRTELRNAIAAGAFGFTTSRSDHHRTADDRPVASRAASWSEVEALVDVLADTEIGTFQITDDRSPLGEQAEHDRQLSDLAVASGVTTLIPASGGATAAALDLIEDANHRGATMIGLVHPRGIGTLSSFRTRLVFDQLAAWSEIRSLPETGQIDALRDAEVRRRLIEAAHRGPYRNSVGAEARAPDYERMQLMRTPVPPWPSVAEVARERGVDPIEVILDEAIESGLDRFFAQTISPFDADATLAAMRHPHTVVSFSDAGAHVSQMSDSSIHTHLLAHWVRDLGAFSLPEAIRMLTYAPARTWGLDGRGLLREGFIADLNVIDADEVAPDMPTVVHDLPGGEMRLAQTASGFRATIVAGQVTIRDGTSTSTMPGRILRSGSFERQGWQPR